MEREAFTVLWQNANRIAESGLQALAGEILQDAESRSLSIDERATLETDALLQLQGMDLSAMESEGLSWWSAEPETTTTTSCAPIEDDRSTDPAASLIAVADLPRIEALLADQDGSLPALDSPLDDNGLAAWTARLRAGDTSLDALISYLCSLR